MKLNKNDRIKADDSIYEVVAVIFSTVYLRTVNDGMEEFKYDIEDVYKKYRDIEFLKERD